eukprot:TRINITY_DN6291_c0_g1_i1.p2 TRINITY_DN6291_c0_g1~~TRINITY_DN6291_c0_g1_i1.p2  ORF type:complete len:158 (+),score=3.32 TRINITY_DN6291_c0_g1_i1:466-939(+)
MLKIGEIVTCLPGIGFNVETIQYKNYEFTCWDVGGMQKIRSLWYHYLVGIDALIWSVDSCDDERLDESAEEFWKVINHESFPVGKVSYLLIYCTKRDIQYYFKKPLITPYQVVIKFRLKELSQRMNWHVLSSDMIASSILEGFEQMYRHFTENLTDN